MLFARVGVSLEPTKACSFCGQDLAIMHDSFSLSSTEQKSSVVEITPELHEFCVDSFVVRDLLW
jgi:hypothetical protein